MPLIASQASIMFASVVVTAYSLRDFIKACRGIQGDSSAELTEAED